jgi:hypothetical protein
VKLQVGIAALALLSGFSPLLFGQSAPAGRVMQVIRSVRTVAPDGKESQTRANEQVANSSSIRTAANGRAELQFPGRALVRLGGNTALQIRNQSRDLHLQDGLVLFRAPRTAGAARLTTGRVTVQLAGSTGLVERFGPHYYKVLVLEGTARVFLPKVGESVLVQPGEMLIGKPDAHQLPEPVHFNIEQLYRTSALVAAPFRQLPSHSTIQQAIQQQKNDPRFAETNLVIFGRGTLVNLLPPEQTEQQKEKKR